MKTVSRSGKTYKVISETKDAVCVEAVFDFAQKPFKRKLKLWWDKKDCDKETKR